MAQDFWAASGFRLLQGTPEGLRVTEAWLARFTEREELRLMGESGANERAIHALIAGDPRAVLAPERVEAIEDPDARENWREFLRFRDRVLAFPTLEACYLDLYARPAVDLAPPFVDALTQAILRAALDGTEDAWLCRAGEMLFRRQRIAAEGGLLLAADAQTLEVFTETGGFGNVGRLLRQQNTALPAVKMDVLSRENAPIYFMRDELFAFVLDITPPREGAQALGRVLERWVGRLAGTRVTIAPVERIEDERWRWHVGLDAEATAILNALYRGEKPEPEQLERLVLLFRLEFADPADVIEEVRGRPVYLGLACRPDRTLRLKPQNLVTSLPLLARAGRPRE